MGDTAPVEVIAGAVEAKQSCRNFENVQHIAAKQISCRALFKRIIVMFRKISLLSLFITSVPDGIAFEFELSELIGSMLGLENFPKVL